MCKLLLEQRTSSQQKELWSCVYSLASSVCICLHLVLSISQIQMLCKSVGRQQLDSVLLSCAIIGGFSWDPAFNITLLLHVLLLQGDLFVHTHKCLSFLLFAVFFFVFFSRDMFSSLPQSSFSFFIVCFISVRAVSHCVCSVLLSSPSSSDSTLLRSLPSFLPVIALD